jgi:predicted ATP-binding protein involved in virulence
MQTEQNTSNPPVNFWILKFFGFSKNEYGLVPPNERGKLLQGFLLSGLLAIIPTLSLSLVFFSDSPSFINFIISSWIYLAFFTLEIIILRLNRPSVTLSLTTSVRKIVGFTPQFILTFVFHLIISYTSAFLFFMYFYEDRIQDYSTRKIAAQVELNLQEDYNNSVKDFREGLDHVVTYDLLDKDRESLKQSIAAELSNIQLDCNRLLKDAFDPTNAYSKSYKKNMQKKGKLILRQLDYVMPYLEHNVDPRLFYSLQAGQEKLNDAIAQQDSLFTQAENLNREELASVSFRDKYEVFVGILYDSSMLTPLIIFSLLLAIVFSIPVLIVSNIKIGNDLLVGGDLIEFPQTEKRESTKKENPSDILKKLDDKLKEDPDNINYLEEKVKVLIDLKSRDYIDILTRVNELKQNEEIKTNVGYTIKLVKLETFDLEFFGSVVWNFEASNILLGKNGYGKSHLLTLIVGLLQRNEKVCRQFFTSSADKKEAFAKLSILVGEERQEIIFNKAGFTSGSNQKDLGVIPVLAISELRFIDKSKETISKPQEDFELRKSAYHFINRLSLGKILDARLYSICLDLSSKTGSSELLKIIENVYERLTSSSFKIIEAVRTDTSYQLFVLTEGNKNRLAIQKASQGTLSILSIVSLIYKYLQLILEESGITVTTGVSKHNGIVIIDEIDAHLHPSWQQNLIEILKDNFPNIQFIIASHSPLVVAGCKENEVNVLRKGETSGFYIQQIKRHFIGVTVDQLYQSIFEIEDKDETFKKYSAMIPLKSKFKEEIQKIESKRELKNKSDVLEYDNLISKQYMLKEQAALFKMLHSKEERTDEENQMFESLCSHLNLRPDSTDAEIANKSELDEKELSRLKYLTDLQQLDPSSRDRLDKLYNHIHYINIVEQQSQQADVPNIPIV